MITDDAILVNMVLNGKRTAFDELVRKHRSRVLSEARKLVGRADGAEDVAQQAQGFEKLSPGDHGIDTPAKR
jgi:DNA-directed RNA polymerase specialized sigma24 family protein